MDVKKLAGLLRGRIVSDLEAKSDHLVLRFGDGSALVIEPRSRGFSVVLHEIANRGQARLVSAPSAHMMVKTLERRGFITRDRDIFGNVVPRSTRVLIDYARQRNWQL